jgi:hypothetical protein
MRMRWGLATGLVIVVKAVTLIACDSPQHDSINRYYFASDASDDDSPPDGRSIVVPAVGPDGALLDGPAGDGANPVVVSDAGLGLALTGWWRAAFAAAPWIGSPSLGSSGIQNLGPGVPGPAAGALLNGMATADFNGTSSYLTGGIVTTFMTPSAFSGWALVNVNAIKTNNTDWFTNDGILCTGGSSYFGVYLRDDGAATVTVGVGALATTVRTVSTTIAKNTWQLVQWRSNGLVMSIRVNGGAWATTDTGATGLAGPLEVGRNPLGGGFLKGQIADIGLASATLADLDFDAVRAYATSRYGMAF